MYISYIHTYLTTYLHTYIHACIHTYIQTYIHTCMIYIYIYYTYMYLSSRQASSHPTRQSLIHSRAPPAPAASALTPALASPPVMLVRYFST